MNTDTRTDRALSPLEKAIRAERDAAAKRIRELKQAAAAEQQRLDLKVVDLLRKQHGDVYAQLVEQATSAIEAEKDKRSQKARAAAERRQRTQQPQAQHGGGEPQQRHPAHQA